MTAKPLEARIQGKMDKVPNPPVSVYIVKFASMADFTDNKPVRGMYAQIIPN